MGSITNFTTTKLDPSSSSTTTSTTGRTIKRQKHQLSKDFCFQYESLLPGLPEHIAQICLSLVQPSKIYSVCKSWRRLIYSSSFPPFLSIYTLLLSEPPDLKNPSSDSIKFSCFDPISAKWHTLPPPPLRRLLLHHPSFISRRLPVQSVTVSGHLILPHTSINRGEKIINKPGERTHTHTHTHSLLELLLLLLFAATGEFQIMNPMYVEQNPGSIENGDPKNFYDDDGREKRSGTLITASAHIITAVIGSGVLSLAWAIAQLGWVAGPAVLMAFSFITYFTSTLLVDCYRSPGPITGKRNYTYMDVVRSHLGGVKVQLCGLAQYGNLVGVTIGYTITASISMVAVKRSNCFHKHGHHDKCSISNNPFMIIFAAIQIILSQIPNFHKLSWLSIVAAVMSFTYASIGLGLSIAKAIGGTDARTTLTGVTVGVDVSGSEKVWKTFQAIGDIAFAYAYSTVLIEIQDTLRSHPPESKVMKKASGVGVTTTTFFYVLCGCVGYAAFGNKAPGNFLTGFGFYEPFWLIDFANICIAIHLIGAYQVFAQPIFGFVELRCSNRWPENKFINKEHALSLPFGFRYPINMFRLVWRSVYVVITAVLAMIFPFFNEILGLIGAASFYPLTVYFPIEMHIAQAKIPKYSFRWVWLKVLSWACLIVSLVAAAGSIQGVINDLKTYKPFQTRNEE